MSTDTTTGPRSAERSRFLSGIIVTAIEGGINYWARVIKYDWYSDEIKGGTAKPATDFGGANAYATLVNLHETNGEERQVTVARIEMTVAHIASGADIPGLWASTRAAVVIGENSDGDNGVIYPEMADQIVQVALYGEVRYC